jgi:hypothetical protein
LASNRPSQQRLEVTFSGAGDKIGAFTLTPYLCPCIAKAVPEKSESLINLRNRYTRTKKLTQNCKGAKAKQIENVCQRAGQVCLLVSGITPRFRSFILIISKSNCCKSLRCVDPGCDKQYYPLLFAPLRLCVKFSFLLSCRFQLGREIFLATWQRRWL